MEEGLILFILFMIIYAINLLLVLIKKKSRVISAISIIMMFLIAACNYNNADYKTYEYLYSSGGNTALNELGYSFITNTLKSIGLDYHQFLIIVFLIFALLIIKSINYYGANPHIVFLILGLNVWIIYIIQIRDAIVTLLLLYSVRYIKDNKYIKYIFVVGIMTLFHSISYSYLAFAMLFMFRHKKIKKEVNEKLVLSIDGSSTKVKNGKFAQQWYTKTRTLISWITISFLLALIISFSDTIIYQIQQLLIRYFISDKPTIINYLQSRSNFGFIWYFMLLLPSFISLVFLRDESVKKNGFVFIKDIKLINICLAMNVIASFFISLTVLNVVFYRIIRAMYVINAMCFAHCRIGNKLSIKTLLSILLIIVSVAFWTINEVVMPNSAPIFDIFNSNYLVR